VLSMTRVTRFGWIPSELSSILEHLYMGATTHVSELLYKGWLTHGAVGSVYPFDTHPEIS
jgi:hypothetical protein